MIAINTKRENFGLYSIIVTVSNYTSAVLPILGELLVITLSDYHFGEDIVVKKATGIVVSGYKQFAIDSSKESLSDEIAELYTTICTSLDTHYATLNIPAPSVHISFIPQFTSPSVDISYTGTAPQS